MAAIVARSPALPSRTATPPPHLTLNTSTRGTPAPVPNKHLPFCSPGPTPRRGLETPPASPPTKNAIIESSSVLYPPDNFTHIFKEPPIYSIDAKKVVEAVEQFSSQPLPDTKQVFPWLHGLHAENQMQLAFFVQRKKALRRTPKCIRGITIVKAGGDLNHSKLKGAIAPEELLVSHNLYDSQASFIECDPKDGFSVRNFQIQIAKMAAVSDIIVYGDSITPSRQVINLAKQISLAQIAWRERHVAAGAEPQVFNTFAVTDSYDIFEANYGSVVAIDSKGKTTGQTIDFFHRERFEMCVMSKASEISKGVYLGPTPDQMLECSPGESDYDVLIEASDLAHVSETSTLNAALKSSQDQGQWPLHLDFLSSGSILPPTWSHMEVDGLMEMCKWIYEFVHEQDEFINDSKDEDGDNIMMSRLNLKRKVLIHCADGYTESSLLGLAYFMYAEGLTVHEAWIKLHVEKGRNFFAYPTDVALLKAIQPRILSESPRWKGEITSIQDPKWLARIDGSLPSRILPYMYLGNLGHANNPDMLKELGIKRILSVGEPINWAREENSWPTENLLYIDRVQDNGVDPLTEEFDKCLRFIERGKQDGSATLVHCRVGVSRSATICIAEVMSELGLSFPRAYCFVRARRLNVIIQPHLRFTYELLKWEEYQRLKCGAPLKRELEWATVCREIALMNKPYSRQ
ncbi:dual specificity protein phosphatase-like protein PPS1 [Pseudovirgaria hyperparasitica]|uniref:Dual specificity protein phosphatase-like protein PPS1 n=1 Tax=Pseudovirgaria hyperparasitica TaxID=470096 RepID=A0A6A6VUL4_9PEZI|nr:dual specificity protein phosphatase-like protein PPS1 [Pseudovirgaria hyperparasitica]KAF2753845.1 dual specificity protein phosphatase-like protein PPS1 [Pseudovirgaria hyperparasitica]